MPLCGIGARAVDRSGTMLQASTLVAVDQWPQLTNTTVRTFGAPIHFASMSSAGHSHATIDIHSADDGVGLRRIRHEARYGNDGGTRPPPILHAVRAMRRHAVGPRMV